MRDDAKEARARQIEEAAYKLLEEKGYAGLSILGVARAARASNETIYAWYGDKLGLFTALITRNAGLVRDALDETASAPPMERLERAGLVLLKMLLSDRTIALNRAAAADGTGALGATLAKHGREDIAPRMSAVISDAITAGVLSGPAPDITETFLALLIGDLQIRRATGALAAPTDDTIHTRTKSAISQLTRLFPPKTP